jgi:phosphate transport system protein
MLSNRFNLVRICSDPVYIFLQSFNICKTILSHVFFIIVNMGGVKMAGRQSFQVELEKLHIDLLRMGSLVEEAIHLSVRALASRDLTLAEKVIADDDRVDMINLHLEKECFRLIALQQPMASDLRRIAAVLKVVTDFERMADHAVSIAKAVIHLKEETYIKPLIDIPKMASLTQAMVRDALTAYINTDIERCYKLANDDHAIDKIYKEVHNELIETMKENKDTVFQGTQLLFVAHYLERIADHATNLAEWVIYIVTGKLQELND